MSDVEKYLDSVVRKIPDFPKPGILFYDITGILVEPKAFKLCIDEMVARYSNMKIDAVAGIESRGFIFAAPLAERLGIPLILIRKKGKLPGETYSCKYSLEYGSAEIEVHKADIKENQNILEKIYATVMDRKINPKEGSYTNYLFDKDKLCLKSKILRATV